jgi:hypothetical protein
MKICDSQNRNLLLDIIDIAGCNDLYNIDIEQSDGYSKIIFSVFDHWLNEDEAETLIVLYDKEIFQKNTQKQHLYSEYEKVFLEFYTKLYSQHKIYLSFADKNDRTIFFEFDSLEDLRYHIISAVKEEFFSALIVPDLHSLIFNWCDYTHCAYVKETTDLKSDIKVLNKLIKDNGLYQLN